MNYITRYEFRQIAAVVHGLNVEHDRVDDPDTLVTFDVKVKDVNGTSLGHIKFVDDGSPGYVFVPKGFSD